MFRYTHLHQSVNSNVAQNPLLIVKTDYKFSFTVCFKLSALASTHALSLARKKVAIDFLTAKKNCRVEIYDGESIISLRGDEEKKIERLHNPTTGVVTTGEMY